MLTVPIGKGMRIQLPDAPALHVAVEGRKVVLRFDFPAAATESSGAERSGRRGRPLSPARQKLRDAMEADAAARRVRSRVEYLRILSEAGGPKPGLWASTVLRDEAKLAFGKPLGRHKKRRARAAKVGRRRDRKVVGEKLGRRPLPATEALRERLLHDKANGGVRDARHYTKWLKQHSQLDARQVRPIVYRELRAASNR